MPKSLAEVRQESWQKHAFPSWFAKAFHQSGVAIAIATIVGIALMFLAIGMMGGNAGANAGGKGFYAVLSHNVLIAIFAPAFLLPVFSILISLRRYWRATGGGSVRLSDVIAAFKSAAGMKNLSGGHGDGCNFEDEDRFSNVRRWQHQAVMYGFLLCFASTCAGTVMHYVFDLQAPYGLVSLPKLLGIPGGILLSIGTLAMATLKLKADRDLADRRVWGGEMGFIALLFFVSTSGLALYALHGSGFLTELMAFHLGSILAFFLLTPYSKMAHGFYRLAALVMDAQSQRPQTVMSSIQDIRSPTELRT